MKIITFTLSRDGYRADQPGDLTGQYVALDDYQALRSQVELAHGGITLDLINRRVHCGKNTAHLSGREFGLLAYLMQHIGQSATREELIHACFDGNGLESNIVDVYVNYLRNILKSINAPRVIHTVKGHGYSFRAQAA